MNHKKMYNISDRPIFLLKIILVLRKLMIVIIIIKNLSIFCKLMESFL